MRLLGWCVLVVLLIVQVAGLYSSTVPGPAGTPGVDKVGHLVGFALPTLVARLLGARWVVLLMVVHAFVSEPLQGWVAPSRTPDPLDALADLAGVATGLAVAAGMRTPTRGARGRGSGKMDG